MASVRMAHWCLDIEFVPVIFTVSFKSHMVKKTFFHKLPSCEPSANHAQWKVILVIVKATN